MVCNPIAIVLSRVSKVYIRTLGATDVTNVILQYLFVETPCHSYMIGPKSATSVIARIVALR